MVRKFRFSFAVKLEGAVHRAAPTPSDGPIPGARSPTTDPDGHLVPGYTLTPPLPRLLSPQSVCHEPRLVRSSPPLLCDIRPWALRESPGLPNSVSRINQQPCFFYTVSFGGTSSVPALLDSGSACNVISPSLLTPSLARAMTPAPRTFSLLPANGIPLPAHGSLTLTVTFCPSSAPLTVDFVVAPIEPPLILGMSFLRRFEPHVRWRSGRLELDTAVYWPTPPPQDFRLLAAVRPAAPPPVMPPTPHPWVAALLASFSDVLSKPDTLPPDRAVAHCIDLVPHSHAPHVRLRRYAPPEIACLRSEVASLLAKGFVRPSSSPFGANVLFVGKKDGGRRLCFDFRGLNRITTADKFPLPHMTDMFAHLASAKYFSKIDLVSGFHQILLRPSDCPKTAFLTPDGAYE